VGNVIEQLADELTVDGTGENSTEYLRVRLAYSDVPT
jgi:hypothetical protein